MKNTPHRLGQILLYVDLHNVQYFVYEDTVPFCVHAANTSDLSRLNLAMTDFSINKGHTYFTAKVCHYLQLLLFLMQPQR